MSDYLEDWSKAKYVCPECESSEGFWEEVDITGWHAVNINYLHEEGIPVISLDESGPLYRDADWTTAKGNGHLGCSDCTWEGRERDLALRVPFRMGWDGKPLDKPLPGQLDLLDALQR